MRSGVEGLPERRQVILHEGVPRNVGRCAILAAGRYRIAEEMFQACGDALRMVHVIVVALLSFHQFAAQHRAEIGVFAEALVLAREARVGPEVENRCEVPRDVAGPHLVGRDLAHASGMRGIPRRCEGYLLRKQRRAERVGSAVDLIHAVDEGNSQTGFVRGDPLELPDEGTPHLGGLRFAQRNVQQRTDAVFDHGFAQQGRVERKAAGSVGDDEGFDGQLSHLSDLFGQGHLVEQLFDSAGGLSLRCRACQHAQR